MAERRYTRAFKQEPMKLVTQQEYLVRRAAKELGIPVNIFENWLRKAGWQANRIPVPLPGSTLSEDWAVLKLRVRELEEQARR